MQATMKNSITKKDFLRLYNINRTIFSIWCEDLPHEIGIKKTKQTFTPRQIIAIIKAFGIPPYCTIEERKYIELICSTNGGQIDS